MMINQLTYREGKILISIQEVNDAIQFAAYRGWKIAASPLNAVFIVDRAIEKMINVKS